MFYLNWVKKFNKILVSKLSNEELTEAVKELELDEIVDILQNLPEERMKKFFLKCH